jgi:hypothetical protein
MIPKIFEGYPFRRLADDHYSVLPGVGYKITDVFSLYADVMDMMRIHQRK